MLSLCKVCKDLSMSYEFLKFEIFIKYSTYFQIKKLNLIYDSL